MTSILTKLLFDTGEAKVVTRTMSATEAKTRFGAVLENVRNDAVDEVEELAVRAVRGYRRGSRDLLT